MATYDPAQIALYLQHISFPHPPSSLPSLIASSPLSFLTTLMHHQLARITFDSLALHYSPHRTISLDPSTLFHKIVIRGRGGYCMEVNTFFAAVLRSLGFKLFSVGGRVKGGGVWGGWNHMLNIVLISGKKYVVDVGYGSYGPTGPNELVEGKEFWTVRPSRGRLEWRELGGGHHEDEAQKVWVYSIKQGEDRGWEEMYSFTEVEFMSQDFKVMNVAVMGTPQSFFVQNVMCIRFLMEGEGEGENGEGGKVEERKREGKGDEGGKGDELVGVLILHRDYVKRRVGEKVEILKVLETEEDRVEALERWFGAKLEVEERMGIKGLPSELKGKPAHGTGHA